MQQYTKILAWIMTIVVLAALPLCTHTSPSLPMQAHAAGVSTDTGSGTRA